jgi:hypothetical protein
LISGKKASVISGTMPEISQDVFESLYPAPKPVTALELRIRANSGGARTLTPPSSSDRVKQTRDLTLGQQPARSDGKNGNYYPSASMTATVSHVGQFREREFSETELLEEFVQGASDQIFGYKRENSHRYGTIG